jgi:hypothetical protein
MPVPPRICILEVGSDEVRLYYDLKLDRKLGRRRDTQIAPCQIASADLDPMYRCVSEPLRHIQRQALHSLVLSQASDSKINVARAISLKPDSLFLMGLVIDFIGPQNN